MKKNLKKIELKKKTLLVLNMLENEQLKGGANKAASTASVCSWLFSCKSCPITYRS